MSAEVPELEVPAVSFSGDAFTTLTALSEQAGMTIEGYLEESVGLASYCAEVFLKNKGQALGTTVYVRSEKGVEANLLDFLTDPPAPSAAEPIAGIEDPFAESATILYEFYDFAGSPLEALLERLGVGLDGFMNAAVTLRWWFQCAEERGGDMLMNEGHDALIKIGVVE